MATVYQRLTENLKNRPTGFMLAKVHRNRLGIEIAKKYRESDSNESVELVTSIEGKESFTVANYPDSFTPIIDEMITAYYKRLFASIKARKEKEQPKAPEKKLRARKPIKKPVFRASAKN